MRTHFMQTNPYIRYWNWCRDRVWGILVKSSFINKHASISELVAMQNDSILIEECQYFCLFDNINSLHKQTKCLRISF